MDDTVNCVKVGRKSTIVLPRRKDKFGETLYGVRRVMREVGGHGLDYGGKEGKDLRWQSPGWDIDFRVRQMESHGRIILFIG